MQSDLKIIKIAVLLVLVDVIVFPVLFCLFAQSIVLSAVTKVILLLLLSAIFQLGVYYNIAPARKKRYDYVLLSIPLYAMPGLIALLIKNMPLREIAILYLINLVIGNARVVYSGLRHRTSRGN